MVLKYGSYPSSISITWELVETCSSLNFTPDLKNQNRWERGRAFCPPGDSDAWSSLRTTAGLVYDFAIYCQSQATSSYPSCLSLPFPPSVAMLFILSLSFLLLSGGDFNIYPTGGLLPHSSRDPPWNVCRDLERRREMHRSLTCRLLRMCFQGSLTYRLEVPWRRLG